MSASRRLPPARSGTPTASATAATTIAGSVTVTRSTNATPSRVIVRPVTGDGEGQAGLADPSGTGGGDEAMLADEPGEIGTLADTTHEPRQRRRQGGQGQAARRRRR